MTDEEEDMRFFGEPDKPESIKAEEPEEATLFVQLQTEEPCKLYEISSIPGVTEAYHPVGDRQRIIATTQGNITSLAEAITKIGLRKGVKIERFLEASSNNGRPIKQSVMEIIKLNGSDFKCPGC